VAQRIKRLPSIRHKLDRFGGMKLSQMQDIGGCRAVLSSVDSVREVVDFYKTKARMKHALLRDYPYMDEPKASGYRGVHLVYRYYSDRSPTYNGLRIEMQIRSRLQHAWATAVETVGTFTQQSLKSSLGDEQWLRFFALMGSEIAMREGTPLVPDTPTDSTTLRRELRRHTRELGVVERLTAYGETLRYAEEQAQVGHTFLLELELEEGTSTLTIASFDNPIVAADQYAALERAIEPEPAKDAVLVTVESLSALRRAYPNYFLDTTSFVAAVEEAIAA
jgi:hypothetical protein